VLKFDHGIRKKIFEIEKLVGNQKVKYVYRMAISDGQTTNDDGRDFIILQSIFFLHFL